MSDRRTIRFDLGDGVATITLDRPDRMNAISPLLLEEVSAAVDEAVAGGARALLLTGAGNAFCSGADLIGEAGAGLPDDLGALIDSHYNPLIRKLAALDIPIVTALNGPAVGAGLSLALSGDIVIAGDTAYLLLAFVNIGLVPDAGATWFVAKGAGRAKALEMGLLGERLTAVEAKDAGLVTRVVADGQVATEAASIARKLAAMPTRAIGLIRHQVRHALAATLDETLDIERDNQRVAGHSKDFREGVAAFAQKRTPSFEGR